MSEDYRYNGTQKLDEHGFGYGDVTCGGCGVDIPIETWNDGRHDCTKGVANPNGWIPRKERIIYSITEEDVLACAQEEEQQNE